MHCLQPACARQSRGCPWRSVVSFASLLADVGAGVNQTKHHFVPFALQRGGQYTVQGGRERIYRAIHVLQLVQAEQTHSERRRASIHAVLGVFIQLPRHLCTKMVQLSHKGNMRQHNSNRPRTPPAIWIPSPLNKPPMPPTLENTTTTPGDP